MDLQVYGDFEPREEPVLLGMVKRGREVVISVVDKDGHTVQNGDVITLTHDDKLFRNITLNKNIRFKCNKEGRIELIV